MPSIACDTPTLNNAAICHLHPLQRQAINVFLDGNLAWRHLGTFAVVIVCCALVVTAAAQESADEQSTRASADSKANTDAPPADAVSNVYERMADRIKTVGPDAFILLDEHGNPQQVLGMDWEDFFAIWKKQQALADDAEDARRDYTLDEFSVAGSVAGTPRANYAPLTATFRFTLHTAGEVEARLNLAGMILQRLPEAPPRADGRYLDFSLDRGGYLVTLEGEPGETVQVQLDLIAPVQWDGHRASLRLLAPRAMKSSLVLAFENAIEKVVADEGVVLAAQPLAAGGMRVETTDLGGEFTLRWEDRRSDTDQLASVL
ncbi:MAG: hypothetical protein ACR2NU_13370, partial [Aeoliella sp.]